MDSISDKNWIKGAIWTVILGVIAAAIYDLIKDQPIFSSIIQIARNIYFIIKNVLLLDLKLWIVIVVISIYKILKWVLSSYRKNRIPDLPKNRRSYQRDEFDNWTWKWKWKWDSNKNEWIIDNLWPYCKKCDIKLLNKSNIIDKKMKCPKCNQIFRDDNSELDDYKAVESIVYDNIEKNRV